MKTNRKLLVLILVMILVISCDLSYLSTTSVTDTPRPDFNLPVLQTLTASPEVAPSPTFFVPVPLPPLVEQTSISTMPTVVLSPENPTPYVYALQNTNCRKGPGVIYEVVGYLLKGETSEIVARNPEGTWVAIMNLDRPGICYVSLAVVEAYGVESIQILAVFTPLPPPTFTPTCTQAPQPTITYTPELPTAPNPDDPRLNVNPGLGPAGTAFTFEIRDFKPFEQVTIVIKNYDDVLITSFVTTMDANGDKDEIWTSPGDLPVGSYSVIPIDSANKEGKSGTFLIVPAN
jgi:hypothetical protein